MKDIFLGIDIGTSSTKAVLFDRDGMQLEKHAVEYSIIPSAEGLAELDPDLVLKNTFQAVKSCVQKACLGKNSVMGIGVSCQMHSLMAVDKLGKPLTNLIIWADTRAGKESRYIEDNFNIPDLYNRTGCRIQHPMYPLSKILWMKNNNRQLFDRAHKFITIKEYLIYHLYGEYVVDYTLAASQGFYNIHKQQWDEFIIRDIIGIDKSRLSDVVECTFVLRGFKPEFEQELGLSCDTPIVIGSGDGIMANLGCGVLDDTKYSCTIGTSGAIRTSVSKPFLDPEQQTWCYSFTKDMWVIGGAINNGGIVLKWLREEFRKQFEVEASNNNESIYKLFDRYAAEVSPGSGGLVFLPYLTGERSPDWNADARGIMFGLSYSHGRKDIIRAAMEGVMYRMYSIYEVLYSLKGKKAQIIANGGYAASDIWLQMQADIFNREVLVSGVSEASSLGAAFLAMLALDSSTRMMNLLPSMKSVKSIVPNKDNIEIYKSAYNLSMKIYNTLYHAKG